MGHEPRVLPGIAFGVVILPVDGVEGIEGLTELAVATESAHEASLGVEVVAVGTAAVIKVLIVGFLAQEPSYPGDAVICQCIFEALGNGLEGGVLVIRQIVILLQQVHAALV